MEHTHSSLIVTSHSYLCFSGSSFSSWRWKERSWRFWATVLCDEMCRIC